jgi:predicted ATPase
MNIKSIRIRNFRGFRDASIDLKPLTVLLGPNSAGKSAFGHALSAMAHAQWVHGGQVQATLSPRDAKAAEEWPVNLGHYTDLCTEGVKDRIYIDLMTSQGPIQFGFGGVEAFPDLRLSYIRHPIGSKGSAFLPASPTGPSQVSSGAMSDADPITQLKTPYGVSGIELTRRNNELEWENNEKVQMTVGLNGLLLETLRPTAGSTEIPFGSVAKTDVRVFLEHLTYLRASRKRPTRGYEPGTNSGRSPIGYAGEWTASILNSQKERICDFAFPPDVPNSIEEARGRIDTAWDLRRKTLPEAVGMWLERTRLAIKVETRSSLLYPGLIEIRVILNQVQRARDITEIGYGISQVLPILVGGLLQSQGGLFIVDLPEAHLHPRPQADLADFFCSLALSGRSSLIETHSEMFFHRLRLWAAMNKELMDNILVYFFDSPDSDGLCREPRKVRLDFDGELKWPVGFLQEAWETEAKISAIREARRLERG